MSLPLGRLPAGISQQVEQPLSFCSCEDDPEVSEVMKTVIAHWKSCLDQIQTNRIELSSTIESSGALKVVVYVKGCEVPMVDSMGQPKRKKRVVGFQGPLRSLTTVRLVAAEVIEDRLILNGSCRTSYQISVTRDWSGMSSSGQLQWWELL